VWSSLELLVDRYDRAFRQTRPQGFTLNALGAGDNLVLRASVTFVQRMGQRTLWKNPKPEPQNPGSGLTAPEWNCLPIWPREGLKCKGNFPCSHIAAISSFQSSFSSVTFDGCIQWRKTSKGTKSVYLFRRREWTFVSHDDTHSFVHGMNTGVCKFERFSGINVYHVYQKKHWNDFQNKKKEILKKMSL